jgi:hypothetical protein
MLHETEKPLSYTEQYLRLAECLKHQVCHLLKWDEQQFCNYQYNMGIAYLMWYLPCDAAGRDKLLRSRIFWNWWKHTWTMHDESFLSFKRSLKECELHNIRKAYEALHCPRILVNELTPNDVVLAELKTKEAVL